MSRHLPSILITQPQADLLADVLEDAIEEAHGETLEHEENTEEYEYALNRMKVCTAILDQIDPDNPIFDAEAKPGREFDWEAFWKKVDEEEVALDEAEEPVSVARDLDPD